MSIKHPYFNGSLSTRISAVCKDQETESRIFRAIPRNVVKDNLDDFMDYIANKDELYSEANKKVLQEMNTLIKDEHSEQPLDRDRRDYEED